MLDSGAIHSVMWRLWLQQHPHTLLAAKDPAYNRKRCLPWRLIVLEILYLAILDSYSAFCLDISIFSFARCCCREVGFAGRSLSLLSMGTCPGFSWSRKTWLTAAVVPWESSGWAKLARYLEGGLSSNMFSSGSLQSVPGQCHPCPPGSVKASMPFLFWRRPCFRVCFAQPGHGLWVCSSSPQLLEAFQILGNRPFCWSLDLVSGSSFAFCTQQVEVLSCCSPLLPACLYGHGWIVLISGNSYCFPAPGLFSVVCLTSVGGPFDSLTSFIPGPGHWVLQPCPGAVQGEQGTHFGCKDRAPCVLLRTH